MSEDRDAAAACEFRRLFLLTRDRVLAYAIRRTARVEDAWEALSETYLIAWQKVEDVPLDESSIIWLYATCRRVLANSYRKQSRAAIPVADIGNLADRQLIEWTWEGLELSLAAKELLSGLTEADREILMLVAWEGLDCNSAAGVLGCSAVAARVRLHRARNSLAREMRRSGLLPSVMPASRPIEERNGRRHVN